MPKTKLIKAILLNIFVIPGAGHAYLKHKGRGAIFTGITITILFVFVIHLSMLLNQQLNPIVPQGDDFAELFRIATVLSGNLMTDNLLMIRTYVFILGTAYIASIADLFMLSHEG